MNSSIMGVVGRAFLITIFCLSTPLVWAADTVLFEIDNPANATEMVISFGVVDAQNDWWWAIDNVIDPRLKLGASAKFC